MKKMLAAISILLWTGVASAGDSLRDFPVWSAMEGWWRAENTYFNGSLDYNIRAYNSLIHVELLGSRYRETEYKFYPPGKMASQIGRGKIAAGEGIETVTILTGSLLDERGTVKLEGDEVTTIQVLSADTAVRLTGNPATGVDTYRMFIFLPTPDKRYRSNFGLVSDTVGAGAANAAPGARFGDLRGFSLFREDRMAATEFSASRGEFRRRNQVAAVVETAADGTVTVRRLPASGERAP